jgi:hypothetical protein
MSSQGLAWVLVAALGALTGCGSDNESIVQEAQGQNCAAGASYEAFDAANHAAQDARLDAHVQMMAKADEALDDPTQAAAAYAAIESLYTDTAELQAKVKGRADDHAGGDPAVGAEIDSLILATIAKGKAATTDYELDVAKEVLDKALKRFFYLSVYHELVEGTRGTYDEAYGYLGTGPTNAEGEQRALARVARTMDGINGTTLSSDLFASVRAGSCALDQRLTKDGAESIDWTTDEAYAAEVREIDGLLLDTMALYVGHEMFELAELDIAAEPDEAKVKVYEGAHAFYAIEPAMKAMGGTAATDAAAIRQMYDDAIAAIESGDEMWHVTFDAASIKDKVAAAFGVTVKG